MFLASTVAIDHSLSLLVVTIDSAVTALLFCKENKAKGGWMDEMG